MLSMDAVNDRDTRLAPASTYDAPQDGLSCRCRQKHLVVLYVMTSTGGWI